MGCLMIFFDNLGSWLQRLETALSEIEIRSVIIEPEVEKPFPKEIGMLIIVIIKA